MGSQELLELQDNQEPRERLVHKVELVLRADWAQRVHKVFRVSPESPDLRVVCRDRRVCKEHKAAQESPDPTGVPQEQLEPLDPRVRVVNSDCRDLLVPPVIRARTESRARLDRRELMA